ncbi:heme exporter protein CcmD [Marivivens sp. LCG002]|nr:heme exporter protein CcmD [Marivivens sp. LCG002]WIV49565.1 heme exporter protein CcmD [Marivivens sp. LCG002]
MPELGKYAVHVLSSYGLSLALLVGIVAVSLVRSRSVKARLEALEKQDG